MQEAVNSVMLWLTKCQKTVEVCSHLFRQKRLDFKEVDDLRSDQGCPRYSSTQYVRWHVRKQWEELSTCSYWWLCVHTFTRFGRWSIPFKSVCLLSQNWHPPTIQVSCATDKVKVLTCFLNSCLQRHFTNFPLIENDKSVIELKHLSIVNKTLSSGD